MIMSGSKSSSRYIFDAFRRYNSETAVIPRNPIQESVTLNTFSFTSNSTDSRFQKRSRPFVDGVKRFYNVVGRNKVEVVEDLKICRWLSENKRKISISIVLLGCGFIITLCLGNMESVPFTNRSHFVLLSASLENLICESLFADIKSEKKQKILGDTNPESIRVSKIAREMVETARCQNAVMEGFKWEVIVVDEPNTVNAYCLPGGKIAVFTGLLTHFREDAEIATVIGHEVGHAVARHVAEKINTSMWLKIIKLIFNQYYTTSDVVNKMSAFFLELPYSRRMEMEADYIGLVLMSCAGYDPRVAPEVYEKLGKIGGGSTWALEDYISTHPSGNKRSKLLSQAKVMDESLSRYMGVQAGRGGGGV